MRLTRFDMKNHINDVSVIFVRSLTDKLDISTIKSVRNTDFDGHCLGILFVTELFRMQFVEARVRLVARNANGSTVNEKA